MQKGKDKMRNPCIYCKCNKSECIKCVEQLALEKYELKDKLSRSNMQIKDLKKEVEFKQEDIHREASIICELGFMYRTLLNNQEKYSESDLKTMYQNKKIDL